ncbi:MAG TPA: ATP-binding cassette domain-containing protein [Candidatus Scatomorpha pullistercoris]|uniref:ATP-binding cassette domain-containing protein n=1 Tax=Candidatus Scatomorpha pullistercoris TaxID=2840929 RepID=A0A9D1K913_9FIRM|nr:ATP-binding cassette domain-containing protein [Candidatus Scatomorpha pullistercoris]
MSTILEVQNLKKYFPVANGQLHAVDDVSLKIEAGTTLGVVGESGCGKSTLGRTILHLLDSTSGKIIFDGTDITHVKGKELGKLREKMQIIFQDPFSSLDPRLTVSQIIAEPLEIRGGMTKADIGKRTSELMRTVGLDERFVNSYPHELDGGRRQRIGIARALSLGPKFIVCDEPVSALDVSIQAQIINLLKDFQSEFGLTYMFISHDLSVVEYISDEVAVMYLGEVIEKAATEKLFAAPLHPYTKALNAAVPQPNVHAKRERQLIKGELSSPIDPAPGCRFRPRCPYAADACAGPQKLTEVVNGHFVSCCRAKEINNI